MAATVIHFINVGLGNMALIQTANGKNLMIDCHVTDDNVWRVTEYIKNVLGEVAPLAAFICTQREDRCMRGIKTLHEHFPIRVICDSDFPGTDQASEAYRDYMALRKTIGGKSLKRCTHMNFGQTRLSFLSSMDERLKGEPQSQGLVLRVEHRGITTDRVERSVIFSGDSDADTWRNGILQDFSPSDLSSDFLVASNHGSTSFFRDRKGKPAYTDHLAMIEPVMVMVSVDYGDKDYPNEAALDSYRSLATGSKNGYKLMRTDIHGTMKLTLASKGRWNLATDQQ